MAKKVLNGLDLNNQKITNLADGAAATDGVTLQQMQAFVRGLSWKASVRAASTANVTLASPGTTLDGVTLISGDRVLLKNQTAGAENGIYVWTGSGSALTRATDMDTAAKTIGATVLVTEGTTNADKAYTMNTDTVTLNTTTLTWAQFGGGGTTYTAGNGLQLATSTFSVLLDTSSGLIVSGTGLKIDTAVVVRKYATNIGDGSSTSLAVTHNFGSKDVDYSIQEVATGIFVDTDVVATNTNTLTFTFPTAPASAFYRVVVQQ